MLWLAIQTKLKLTDNCNLEKNFNIEEVTSKISEGFIEGFIFSILILM